MSTPGGDSPLPSYAPPATALSDPSGAAAAPFADPSSYGAGAATPAGLRATGGDAATTAGDEDAAAARAAERAAFRDALAAALAPGLVLGRELTGGGMSRVFVADEVALGRTVVVKVLPPDLAAGVNRERFRREIQVAARLQHPHIVPLLAAGEAAGSLYYTMPFVDGASARERVHALAARGLAMSVREALRILHDVVEALAFAHARGVVHRDVKPGNVLLQDGHALVADFGVAKAISAALPTSGLGVTSVGLAIGTPAYMAPEQLAADPAADHRMDLYAAGLLAYELLTGASPFAATSPQATLAAQLTRLPAPLHTVRADVPTALSAVIMRCLAKEPAERWPDAAALLGALEEAAQRTGDASGDGGRAAWPGGAHTADGLGVGRTSGETASVPLPVPLPMSMAAGATRVAPVGATGDAAFGVGATSGPTYGPPPGATPGAATPVTPVTPLAGSSAYGVPAARRAPALVLGAAALIAAVGGAWLLGRQGSRLSARVVADSAAAVAAPGAGTAGSRLTREDSLLIAAAVERRLLEEERRRRATSAATSTPVVPGATVAGTLSGSGARLGAALGAGTSAATAAAGTDASARTVSAAAPADAPAAATAAAAVGGSPAPAPASAPRPGAPVRATTASAPGVAHAAPFGPSGPPRVVVRMPLETLRARAWKEFADSVRHVEWRSMARELAARTPLPPVVPLPPDAPGAPPSGRVLVVTSDLHAAEREGARASADAMRQARDAGAVAELSRLAATLPPAAPGERRVLVVPLRDASGRRDLGPTATDATARLRAALGGRGVTVLDPALGAVVHRARLRAAHVADATGAGAVVYGTLLPTSTPDSVALLVQVYDARRGASRAVRVARATEEASAGGVGAALAAAAGEAVGRLLDAVTWTGPGRGR